VVLDFPESHFGYIARLGSSDVVPDRCPTEKQAPAGELAGLLHLAHTNRVALHPSPGLAGPAAGTLA
jgi:hypothetical protein